MFTGCGTALVTPFQNDFSLDEACFAPAGCGGKSRQERIFWCLRTTERARL